MRSVAVIGVMLGSVMAANAADLPIKAPLVPESNWTALYIGGFAGGTWVDGTYGLATAPTGVRSSSIVGGMYIGYDYELANKFVIGAKLSAPLAAVTPTLTVPFGIPGETVKPSSQWAAATNLTIGYDMGQWMPYFGLGAIFAENKVTLTVPGVGSGSDSQLHPGLNVLAGLKYAMTRNWAVGVQYNHSQFASETYSWGAPLFGSGVASFNQNSVVGTVEYRF